MRALADHGIAATGTDGINIWIPLPRDEAMAAALGRCGWAVMSGAAFRITEASGIRVTIADLTTEEAQSFARDLARLIDGGYMPAV